MLKNQIDRIKETNTIDFPVFQTLLTTEDEEVLEYLRQSAREVADGVFQRKIYIRGLIEFTNFCNNNCYYCGIRRDNASVGRYRLTKEDILSCCEQGYNLGFRTFVLQGGEDPYFDDERMVSVIAAIHERYPDCAITLSIGEKSKDSYEAFFRAGATRYLLRHETADETHYGMLHPEEMSLRNRKQCLWDLKEIGYQVGCGFMVGSPHQTLEHLYEDLLFIQELKPHMIGIGPFLPQKDTPFGKEQAGSAGQTFRLLSILRLMLPEVLLPATTALGTLHPKGRELAVLSGANVVMPNLSPDFARKQYCLYDNKAYTGCEAAEGLALLREQMKSIGYEVEVTRGDSPVWEPKKGGKICMM